MASSDLARRDYHDELSDHLLGLAGTQHESASVRFLTILNPVPRPWPGRSLHRPDGQRQFFGSPCCTSSVAVITLVMLSRATVTGVESRWHG
jgi:hypothetical protein